jgi:penicillin-binding protein 1C
MVLAILADAPPPPGVMPAILGGDRLPIAVKTGTSYGFRDAWAFGVTAEYTVGVWTGRPDGTPSPGRFGRNTAAPLVYKAFDLLPERRLTPAAPREAAFDPPPPSLQRLPPQPRDNRPIVLEDPEALRLSFPTPGVILDLLPNDEGILPPVGLVATGGRRPLLWLVDARPITDSFITSSWARRETQWMPEAPGWHRITVIDAEGRTASAEIFLRTDPE